MPISGVLIVCQPERIQEVRTAVDRLDWADAHHSGDDGRLVVTVDAASTDESMGRLLELKAIPHVIMAELVEHYVGDENLSVSGDSGEIALDRLNREGFDARSKPGEVEASDRHAGSSPDPKREIVK